MTLTIDTYISMVLLLVLEESFCQKGVMDFTPHLKCDAIITPNCCQNNEYAVFRNFQSWANTKVSLLSLFLGIPIIS